MNIICNKRIMIIFYCNKIISLLVFILSKDVVLVYLDNNGVYFGRYVRVYVDKVMENFFYFVEYQIGLLYQVLMVYKVFCIVRDYDR